MPAGDTIFHKFCADGEAWMQTASEADKSRVTSALEDFLILRRSAREESYILKLNRIGLERDTKE